MAYGSHMFAPARAPFDVIATTRDGLRLDADEHEYSDFAN
jgi:hypothetical protein